MTTIRGWLSALLVGLVMMSGCSDDGASVGDPAAPSRVEGPIIRVQSEGLGHVRAFTVKSGDETYDVQIADGVDYGFPLEHLSEHRVSGEPVVVELEERDGKLFALSIEDA